MLKIRLARVGKKKSPAYRFVVSENARDLYGKQLEILGHYNPFSKVCEVKKDRILYWISQGAQVSPTAHNLLVDQNVITKEKVKASKSGKKRELKLANPEAEEKPAASQPVAEAAEKPAEAPAAAAAETPAEEKRELKLANPEAEEKLAEAPAAEPVAAQAPVAEPAAEAPKAEEKTEAVA
ncbi:MAG: 30S ribosomal protein S16 [Candidatus Buchananbacteria bacterium RIFCSPLOWO2_01_FULL_45_31]|uniref:Small ribosomal subunit protein bS16 n=1 Tax=Candidatus Buchananbacteria bacterium RIFCSPLOWO2_01_FULL_45_31 TaxID=1797545 RepID=A0A1G1YNT3_9BACT|nr:MAG: 30S ribosomal protein S16 [Candidatus Buchananbacteria bacterium RIFCSPLOWO2_01_FULL_45_31]